MRLTIAECVAARALAHPDHPAIDVLGGSSLTYGEAWRRVTALADAVRTAEPGPHGRMVAVLLGNSADALLAYLACQWAGVTAVPVNNRLAAPEVGFIVGDSGARLILTDHAHAEAASKAARDHGARLLQAEDIATPAGVSRPSLGEAGRGAVRCRASSAIRRARPAFPRGRCTATTTT